MGNVPKFQEPPPTLLGNFFNLGNFWFFVPLPVETFLLTFNISVGVELNFAHNIYEHFLFRWYPTFFPNKTPHRPIVCFLSAQKQKGWTQARHAQSVPRVPKAKTQYYTCFYFEHFILEFLSLLSSKSEIFFEFFSSFLPRVPPFDFERSKNRKSASDP